jgi:hypothetical protein
MMSYSILSQETRQQLEQERFRLVHDREAILASVTAELDRLVQQLDRLLGNESTDADAFTHLNGGAVDSAAPVAKLDVFQISANEAKVLEPDTDQTTPKAKQQDVKAFDAKQLKLDFKDMSASDAVVQILRQSPDQTFETDELIEALYEPFDQSDMGRARKSMSAVLLYGSRAGKFEKVQEHPARYKLKESVATAA